jgi:MoxR-like ATPase
VGVLDVPAGGRLHRRDQATRPLTPRPDPDPVLPRSDAMTQTADERPTAPPPAAAAGADLAGAVVDFAEHFSRLQANVEWFLVGKAQVVRLALVCLLAEGHLLIDDVPGVGKTSLAKAIAASISGSVSRIQFTPDLLPSDVTGTPVWQAERRTLEFRAGPVFANVVIADEINRASPKTQSALLEVMEEGHVTVEGSSRPVPRPFLVIATQNPVDFSGTYDLPEAQIDRFLMRLTVGYPERSAEVDVVLNHVAGHTPEQVAPVTDVDTVRAMIAVGRRVHVARTLAEYCVRLCEASRELPEVRLGASPRGSVALVTAGQVHAAAHGRAFVTADDVKAVAPHVLGHRLLLTHEAEAAGARPATLLDRLTASVPVPRERPTE